MLPWLYLSAPGRQQRRCQCAGLAVGPAPFGASRQGRSALCSSAPGPCLAALLEWQLSGESVSRRIFGARRLPWTHCVFWPKEAYPDEHSGAEPVRRLEYRR